MMEISSRFVGTPLKPLETQITWRQTTNYAAALGDTNPRYLDDEALLMYTSGSTGKPKGVVHTHASIVENIKVEVTKFFVDGDSRCLLHFPINHVAADVEIGFAAVMAGGAIIFMEQFDPVGALKTIEQEKITMFGQVPVMFLLQMKQPDFFQTDFSHVRLMAWAGAAAPKVMVDVLSKICAKTGSMLITGYGST